MRSFKISTTSTKGAVVRGIVKCNDAENRFFVNIPQWELNLILDKDQAGEYCYQHEHHLPESKLFNDIISQIERNLYQ